MQPWFGTQRVGFSSGPSVVQQSSLTLKGLGQAVKAIAVVPEAVLRNGMSDRSLIATQTPPSAEVLALGPRVEHLSVLKEGLLSHTIAAQLSLPQVRQHTNGSAAVCLSLTNATRP